MLFALPLNRGDFVLLITKMGAILVWITVQLKYVGIFELGTNNVWKRSNCNFLADLVISIHKFLQIKLQCKQKL